jgi:hypothetical protein
MVIHVFCGNATQLSCLVNDFCAFAVWLRNAGKTIHEMSSRLGTLQAPDADEKSGGKFMDFLPEST